MKIFISVINTATRFTRYIALLVMASMMLFITFGVINRWLFTPIIGDIELVQLGMVVLIMCGLAYTEQAGSHIAIGIIVDRFPLRVQKIFDFFANLLTTLVTITIGYIYIEVALNHQNHMQLSTGLLNIPYYPIDYIIVLGFIMWGLQGLLKLVILIVSIFQTNQDSRKEV